MARSSLPSIHRLRPRLPGAIRGRRSLALWLAPPAAVVAVLLLAFYTNARGRGQALALADAELRGHLESGERVLYTVPASQRHWYDLYRATNGVLAATTRRIMFVGVVPELYTSGAAQRVLDVNSFEYDTTFAIAAAGPAIERRLTLQAAGRSARYSVPRAHAEQSERLVAAARRRDSTIRDAQRRERQFYDSLAALPPIRDYYRVQRGDALDAIARRFQTTGGAIQRLNSLSGDRILVGQTLLVRETQRPIVPCPPAICAVLQSAGGDVVP